MFLRNRGIDVVLPGQLVQLRARPSVEAAPLLRRERQNILQFGILKLLAERTNAVRRLLRFNPAS
jgi:hypothetical protein